jgi:hypothetical protein
MTDDKIESWTRGSNPYHSSEDLKIASWTTELGVSSDLLTDFVAKRRRNRRVCQKSPKRSRGLQTSATPDLLFEVSWIDISLRPRKHHVLGA